MEKVFAWTTPAGAIRAEAAHWRSVSVEERVSAVETLREATPGIYGEVPARLERVYRFVERAPRQVPRRRSARRRRRG